MKQLLIILSFALMTIIAGAQTKADYQKMMTRFVKFYNNKQGDSVVKLWQFKDRKNIERLWSSEEMNKLHEKYGKITSFKYLKAGTGKNEGVGFTTIFRKLEPNGSTMQLDNKNFISSFILINSEPKDKSVKKGK